MTKQRIKQSIFLILCFFILCTYCLSAKAITQSNEFKSFCNNEKNSINIHQIAYSPQWLSLVHYRPQLWGNYISSIDSDNFFLSKDGKTNPESELISTIKLFTQKKNTSKQCLFPARYTFLKKNGLIKTPYPTCTEFEKFQKDLNPANITFLYTDAYMNNPSSLFGHTLMRIDIPEGKTQLVAHGVNYGAYVDEKTAGPLYAIYGLTGGYYGGFTVKPYYNVINMYNNMENRDIWEYTLNLSDSERDFFIAHLWEIGHTQTRYYFFTKNCSYLLMEALDAVRPELKLSDDFPLQTIPLDTVKAINNRKNMVKSINYRPSRQRRIAYRYEQMNTTEKKALIHYVKTGELNHIKELPEKSQINILDTTYEYIQYEWVKQHLSLKDYRKKSLHTLTARRNIETQSSEVIVPQDSVLNSHDSMRLQFSTGTHKGNPFTEIGWRAAYHSLNESPIGLLEGAEINFLDTVLRYYPQQNRLQFQHLNLIKISSFSPYNALFHPISYQIDTYISREWNPKTNEEKLMYTIKGGSGLTIKPFKQFYIYGLANTLFRYGGNALPHNLGIAFGLSAGFIYYLPRTQVQTEITKSISDNWMLRNLSAMTTINYNILRNWQIGVSYGFSKKTNRSENTFKFSVNHYF